MDSKELRGLYEAYNEVYAPQEVDEAVKGESGERREDLAAERRSGIKPLSAKEGEGYASHKLSQMSYVKRQRMGEEVEEVGEEMKPLPKNKMFRKAGNLGRDIVSPATGDEDRQKKYGRQKKIIRQLNKANEQLEESGLSQDTIRSAAKERQKRVDTAYAKDTPQGDAEGNAGMKKLARTKGQLNINKPREVRMRANEEFDIFDAILEHLIAEGYADTNESALVIMANMSEEWRQSIVEGDNYDKNRKRAAQRAAERNAARDSGKTGNVPGVGYVTPRRERETYVDAAGTTRHKSGAKMP
jgi:hypothetical protein